MKKIRVYFAEHKEETKNLRKRFEKMTKEEIIEEYLDLMEEKQDEIYESWGEDN
jgi:hypothetical protein